MAWKTEQTESKGNPKTFWKDQTLHIENKQPIRLEGKNIKKSNWTNCINYKDAENYYEGFF